MDVLGVLWHSTGANNPNLKRYVQPSDTKPAADTYSKAKWLEVLGKNTYANDWNHINREAGLNCWIGKLADGTITTVQTMPWDYRPWGCGSGSKGSCNNGWIQFEICEDGLTDKTYFNKVYKEACEITAYLCKMYNIDPNGTVIVNGVKVPTILCHQDSYKLGMGGNHGDIYHWFPKHGKNMETARADVAAILKAAGTATVQPATQVKTYKVVTPINKYSTSADAAAQKNAKSDKLAAGTYYILAKYPDGVNGMFNLTTDSKGVEAGSWINPKENVIKESTTTPTTQQLYRVRKSKDDVKSQVGAYSVKQNAIEACQKAGAGYHVFDSDYKIVYSYKAPEAPVTLSSIAVSKMPTKTNYVVGEAYDGSGLAITATYSDKTTKVITGYSVTGFSSAKAGEVTVSVTFEGKATSFKITVKEKEVTPVPEKVVEVYNLDYPEKVKIVDKSLKRTDADCVKAIKKILSNNATFDVEIAKAFFKLAPKYGIDPMMAIAQSILETGWFKYAGSAVTADQHNYCGLGVTSTGVKGATFETVEDGVTAQLQHLFAYGCKEALASSEKVLDPRFSLVTRGIATYWQQLAGRWACPGYDKTKYATPAEAMAAGNTYGQKILTLYKSIEATVVADEDVNKYFPVETPTEPSQPDVEKPEVNDPEVNEPEVNAPEVPNENTEDKAAGLANLIFEIIKKLIQMLANAFSKK
jgi:flagellum-specific peptidoglycan hydrolase FlgJ